MPDYHWVIKDLSPDAEFQIWDNDLQKINWIKNPDNITVEQIEAHALIWQDNQDKLKYREQRQFAYLKELGDWTDQLDMIYHDIDDWKAKVKNIKERFPK